jgi:pyridoxamine 5'-phosphate oxidase family protein
MRVQLLRINRPTLANRNRETDMMKTARASTFTDKESRYLCLGGLGRLATVSSTGSPHVVPVTYEFDGQFLYFSGRNLAQSLKCRHISQNQNVALVVDDILSFAPWRARGIEIRGTAEILYERRRPYVRITPLWKVSWGLR